MRTTCTTLPDHCQTLGQLINLELKELKDRLITESSSEYPIGAMLTANVITGDHTPLDLIDDYIKEELERLEKYSKKPDSSKTYLERELIRTSKVEAAIIQLRKSKVETWLYIHDCVRAFERDNGLVGTVLINLPLRSDIDSIGFLDFVNQRATLCQL